jgi:HK97 family phage prohead protease
VGFGPAPDAGPVAARLDRGPSLREPEQPEAVIGFASVTRVEYGTRRGLESIRPGAFEDFLAAKPVIDARYDHISAAVLASTRNGTLHVSEHRLGLFVFCMIDRATVLGSSVLDGIQSGRLAGMSIERKPLRSHRERLRTDHDEVSAAEVSFVRRGANHAALAILADCPPLDCPALPGGELNCEERFERERVFLELRRLAALGRQAKR